MAALQPQQQFVTVAPVAQPQRAGYSERYNGGGGLCTGIFQLICAVLLIILGGAYYGVAGVVVDRGAAIWCGIIFFLPAGILGIVSRNRSSSVITAYLVMSILSCISSFGAMIGQAYLAWAYSALCGLSSQYDNCISRLSPYIALQAVIAILFLVEFIVSLIASIFGCGGVCCGASNTTTTTTMVQYPVGQPGPGAPPQYSTGVKY